MLYNESIALIMDSTKRTKKQQNQKSRVFVPHILLWGIMQPLVANMSQHGDTWLHINKMAVAIKATLKASKWYFTNQWVTYSFCPLFNGLFNLLLMAPCQQALRQLPLWDERIVLSHDVRTYWETSVILITMLSSFNDHKYNIYEGTIITIHVSIHLFLYE